MQAIEDDPKYWEVISSDTSSWLARDCGKVSSLSLCLLIGIVHLIVMKRQMF
jgi:hypothetical protein